MSIKAELTTPICDYLRDYAASGMSRFHMPGHKGKMGFSHDITEIKGADSLYEADGIIRESEEYASRLFGTAATFYSTEGSSQCIRGMLALATDFGMKPVVLAARNVHRAFISAAALLDLDVRWLIPKEGSYSRCSCPVSADQVRTALSKLEELPAAVYLTSPDYLGNLADIASIADAVHAFGIPLLVDNAHGAYLHFLETPIHPIDLGADMCCDSAHKTLPALTGCAYLHISQRYAKDPYIVRRTMSLFGSSSPSYLLLESLDRTNRILATTWREQLANCISMVDSCKASLREMGWQITGDPMRITIETLHSGYCGQTLDNLLRKYQIECEYADPDFVVLMVSPYNTREDFDRLLKSMERIAAQVFIQDDTSDPIAERVYTVPMLPLPEKVLSIREAVFANPISVPADKAIGRICADLAITCPPAVPIVICGERIQEEAIDAFHYYGITRIDIITDSKKSY